MDISNSLEKKISAFSQYKTEVKEFPHPRSLESIKSLAKLRGSQVGVIAAEAFEVVFERI